MIDLLLLLFVLLTIGAIAGTMHHLVELAVDWLSPPTALPSLGSLQPRSEKQVWLEMVRARKHRRLERYREIDRDLRKADKRR